MKDCVQEPIGPEVRVFPLLGHTDIRSRLPILMWQEREFPIAIEFDRKRRRRTRGMKKATPSAASRRKTSWQVKRLCRKAKSL